MLYLDNAQCPHANGMEPRKCSLLLPWDESTFLGRHKILIKLNCTIKMYMEQ
jgi:hypothetical protein